MNSRLAATLLALALCIVLVAVFVARRNTPFQPDRTVVAYGTGLPSAVPLRIGSLPRVVKRPSASGQTPQPSATAPPPTPAMPTAAPSNPTPAPTPSVTLPPVPRFSPDSAPQIVAVSISSQTVHPGDVVSGTVETSSNVASVEAHLATYAIPMQKVGVGKFTLKYQVPDIPFFFRGKTYAIDIVAHNTRGDSVSTSVPIAVR